MADLVLNSALETLCYFDIFDFPLTKEEIHRSLWRPPFWIPLVDLGSALEEYVSRGLIARRHGYYMLPEREATVAIR